MHVDFDLVDEGTGDVVKQRTDTGTITQAWFDTMGAPMVEITFGDCVQLLDLGNRDMLGRWRPSAAPLPSLQGANVDDSTDGASCWGDEGDAIDRGTLYSDGVEPAFPEGDADHGAKGDAEEEAEYDVVAIIGVQGRVHNSRAARGEDDPVGPDMFFTTRSFTTIDENNEPQVSTLTGQLPILRQTLDVLGETYVLVLWASGQTTWIPLSHCSTCREALASFVAMHELQLTAALQPHNSSIDDVFGPLDDNSDVDDQERDADSCDPSCTGCDRCNGVEADIRRILDANVAEAKLAKGRDLTPKELQQHRDQVEDYLTCGNCQELAREQHLQHRPYPGDPNSFYTMCQRCLQDTQVDEDKKHNEEAVGENKPDDSCDNQLALAQEAQQPNNYHQVQPRHVTPGMGVVVMPDPSDEDQQGSNDNVVEPERAVAEGAAENSDGDDSDEDCSDGDDDKSEVLIVEWTCSCCGQYQGIWEDVIAHEKSCDKRPDLGDL